ncbi:Luciferase-like domain containing protein [Naviculisporaceae sp. PSN 640]
MATWFLLQPRMDADYGIATRYWVDLAKLLERGGINALFLADTFGGYDTYKGSLDTCIRRAAQWPVTDSSYPMAAVTKNLAFAITASTSFKSPFLLERYRQADPYLGVLYNNLVLKSITADPISDTYFDPSQIRTVKHSGKYFSLSTRHLIAHIRSLAQTNGRDPSSLKFFANFTPILAEPDELAQEKFENLKKNASNIGGLVLFSGWTGIGISKILLDQETTASDSTETHKISTDLDGFKIVYVATPGTSEDVVDLLVPELRRRGIYPELEDRLTAREKVYASLASASLLGCLERVRITAILGGFCAASTQLCF